MISTLSFLTFLTLLIFNGHLSDQVQYKSQINGKILFTSKPNEKTSTSPRNPFTRTTYDPKTKCPFTENLEQYLVGSNLTLINCTEPDQSPYTPSSSLNSSPTSNWTTTTIVLNSQTKSTISSTTTPSPTTSTLTSTPNLTFTSSTITPFLTSSNDKISTLLDSKTSPTSSSTQIPLTIITIPSEINSTSLSDEEIEPHLNEMNKTLDKPHIDSSNLLKLSEKLKILLKSREMNKNNSLMTAMTVMDKMQKKSRTLTSTQMRDFNDNMVETCSDVLDNHQAWQKLKDPSSKVQLSSKILEYIQTTGFDLGCLNKSSKIIKSNIAIEAIYFDSNTSMDININNSESRVVIPVGMPEPDPDSGCNRGTAVGSVISKLTRYLTNKLPAHQQINSNIVAFSIKDSLNSTQMPNNIEPVKIILKHNTPLMFGDRVQCVYWDFNAMNWSPNGCHFQRISSNRKLSICECNHLTNFAAIMDVSGRETDTKVKDILTKVCCGLSIVCLILTIGFFTLVRALHNRRNNITCNLCLCLLIVNLLAVFGMDRTQNNVLCQTIAAFLLYFILCSFSWMLMEGYHLYQMIVLVFSSVGHLRLTYLYAIGYGTPLLATLSAVFAIGFKNLKETDSYFCWISSPSHPYRVWAVAAPALVVFSANFVVNYLALREAFKAKKRKKQIYQVYHNDNTIQMISEKLSQSFSWIKGFISLVVLLGITWISFVLYIHEFGQNFSYVFIILNGLQGVFIFTFQVLLNDTTRSQIVKTYLKNVSLFSTSSSRITSISSRDESMTSQPSNSWTTGAESEANQRSVDLSKTSDFSHKSQTISMNPLNSILY